MSSTSFYPTATMRCWKKKMDATFGIDEKGLVLVVLLPAVRKSDRSLIGAFLPDLFSEIYQFFRYLSYSSEDRQLEWSSPRSSQFGVASHDLLDLVGNDREFHHNSF